MKVKEIMTGNPGVCAPETSLQDVAKAMVDRDCGAVPIVRGSKLEGIITDRDVVVRAVAAGKNPLALTASACMTSPVVSIGEDATLAEVTELMESKKIRRLVVVNPSGAVVGMVAQADVARHAPKEQAGELVRDVSAPKR